MEPLFLWLLVLHAGGPHLVVLRSLGLVPLPLRQLVLRPQPVVLGSRFHLLAGLGLLGLHPRLRRMVPDRFLLVLLAVVGHILPALGFPLAHESLLLAPGHVRDSPRG